MSRETGRKKTNDGLREIHPETSLGLRLEVKSRGKIEQGIGRDLPNYGRPAHFGA